jgi:hypothetical protein
MAVFSQETSILTPSVLVVSSDEADKTGDPSCHLNQPKTCRPTTKKGSALQVATLASQ